MSCSAAVFLESAFSVFVLTCTGSPDNYEKGNVNENTEILKGSALQASQSTFDHKVKRCRIRTKLKL